MTDTPIRVPRGFRIIAHRGASGYAPENTMAAFRLAERMGAREIEFDLQLTKDGHMVVVHDTVLDRYGYPGLRVAEMTLRDLKQLDFHEALRSTGDVKLATTAPGHIGGSSGTSQFPMDNRGGFETTPRGNAVVLEDVMMKVAPTQMDYQAATALYSRSLGLIKTALGRR